MYRPCYKFGFLSVKAFKYIQDNSIRDNLVPHNSLTNLNCSGNSKILFCRSDAVQSKIR